MMTKEELMKKKNAVLVGNVMLVNATPHPLNIVQMDGTVLTIAPSGECPRRESNEIVDKAIGLIKVTRQTLGNIEGLSEPIPEVYYIVSRLVASASGRDDLLVPGSLIRDNQGNVIGCNGLSRI